MMLYEDQAAAEQRVKELLTEYAKFVDELEEANQSIDSARLQRMIDRERFRIS